MLSRRSLPGSLSRRRFAALLGTSLTSTLAGAAEDKRARPTPRNRTVRVARPVHFRLDNGLDVVLQEDPWQSQVAVVVSYGIGSRDDPPGYAGLAHLVEHLTFRGSRHLKPLESFSLLERAGASAVKGVTSPDRTNYCAVVPTHQLALPLWIESERMAFALERFNQRHFALERLIVENETILRGKQYPSFTDHLLAGAFGEGHPYCAPSDALSDLQAIDLEAVRWFYQQAYRPSNACVVLAGNLDTSRARRLVERYFSEIRNPSVPFQRRPSPRLSELAARKVVYEQRVFQESVSVLWRAPKPSDEERAALQLSAGSLNSALELMTRRGLASTSFVQFLDLELGSLLWAQFDLMKGRTHEKLLAELDAELRRFGQDASAGIADARRPALVEQLGTFQDPLSRALLHVDSMRLSGRPFDLTEELRKLKAVTPETAERVYGRYVLKGERLLGELRRNGRSRLPDRGEVSIVGSSS